MGRFFSIFFGTLISGLILEGVYFAYMKVRDDKGHNMPPEAMKPHGDPSTPSEDDDRGEILSMSGIHALKSEGRTLDDLIDSLKDEET